MSDNIDPRIVQAACMADLSRDRQEELPLSNVEKKGPSFQPSGKNGTSHYAAKLKQDLNNKWSIEFDDEEARQIEGLCAEDARPWAKKLTKHLLETSAVRDAVPTRQHARVQPHPAGPPPSAKRAKRNHPHGQSGPDGVKQTEFKPGLIHSKQPVPPIEAKWGPPKLAPTLNPVLRTPAPPPGNSTQSPISSAAQNQPNNGTATQERPAHLRMKPAGKPESASCPEVLVCSGHCEVVPSKLEADCFEVEFKMVLFPMKQEVTLVLSAPGKGERVHAILDFDIAVMDGGFCKLRHRDSKSDYYLRLTTIEETDKFHSVFQKMQQKLAKRRQGRGVEVKANDVALVQNPEPPVSQVQASQPVHAVNATNSTNLGTDAKYSGSNKAEGTLIDLDGFEEVQNTQIPSLQNAADHIIHLIDKVITQFALEDDLIDSVIRGIEDGAIEYWIANGFMTDSEDDLKGDFISLVRPMAQIKIKMHRRLNGRGEGQEIKAQDAVVRSTESLVGNPGALKYPPEALVQLRSSAIVPNDWKATKDLPVSLSVFATSTVEKVDTTSKANTPSGESKAQQSIKADRDTPIGNTEPTATKPIAQRRPTKGLADSKWAHADVKVDVHSSYHNTRQAPTTQASSAYAASVGGGRRNGSGSSTGTCLQGLSESRFATKPAQFRGSFAGFSGSR
ncbi:hypothetical protein BKA56DRAFT_654394 [Ilyonectria sp. MPI-CAGE-AT-0026]|nr:hypothetical protein BKA56DRAFT_654394 [Ilyonectria sp. MPI-CAGE-AT-0026]